MRATSVRVVSSFTCLTALFCLVTQAYAAAPTNAAEDPLKDVYIYNKPAGIEASRSLALQNRQERIDMLRVSMECIKAAATEKDIHACMDGEQKSIQLISLTYCNTDIGIPAGKLAGDAAQGSQEDEYNGLPVKCAVGAANIRGEPLPPALLSKLPRQKVPVSQGAGAASVEHPAAAPQ